jgi:hypothetical protein
MSNTNSWTLWALKLLQSLVSIICSQGACQVDLFLFKKVEV